MSPLHFPNVDVGAQLADEATKRGKAFRSGLFVSSQNSMLLESSFMGEAYCTLMGVANDMTGNARSTTMSALATTMQRYNLG